MNDASSRPVDTPAASCGDAASAAPGDTIHISASDKRWRDILRVDAQLHRQKGIALLTPEARVLLFLLQAGPVPVTAAMQAAGISYRGFYTVLERLKKAGLVATIKDTQDQRVRRLKIDPSLNLSSSNR